MSTAIWTAFGAIWEDNDKVSFNGVTKRIQVNSDVTALDIQTDVYSAWIRWVERVQNTQYLPAMRFTGLDPVPGGLTGATYFLINGWKLVYDANKVALTGILYSDDYDTAFWSKDDDPIFPAVVSALSVPSSFDIVAIAEAVAAKFAEPQITTSGIVSSVWSNSTRTLTEGAGGGATAQEIWEYATRTLTEGAGGGATAEEVATAVWDKPYSQHDTDGSMGHLVNYLRIMEKAIHVDTDLDNDGDGSQEFPYNNITSAIDRAEEDGIRNIYLAGDIVLNRNVKNLTILGIGVPEFDCNGYDLKNTKLFQVKTKGEFTGTITVQDSVLLNGAFLNGFYENCALAGNLTCVDGADVFIKDCASGIPGTGRPTISMNAGGTATLSLRGYNGGMTIKDCDSVTDRVTVEMNGASLTFDSSCTAGVMVARGVGKFVDETNGATVVDETINREYLDTLTPTVNVDEAAIATAVWNYTQ